MFEDIPLDTRHHTFKQQYRFPKEWRLTEERKKELGARRKEALLLDEKKRAEGSLIDGMQAIQQALIQAQNAEVVPVAVSRGRLTRGRR
jgi:small subunit ribosomal protein S35